MAKIRGVIAGSSAVTNTSNKKISSTQSPDAGYNAKSVSVTLKNLISPSNNNNDKACRKNNLQDLKHHSIADFKNQTQPLSTLDCATQMYGKEGATLS